MAIITGGNVLPGLYGNNGAGAPVAGTDEVQTVTIGGTPTGGSFTLTFNGFTTAPITWTAVDATLVTAIQTALNALPNIGTSGVAVADTTLTSGIGAVTVTFSGANVAKRIQPLMTASAAALTGTGPPTVVPTETTPGVDATGFGVPKGGTFHDVTNGKVYVNTGTEAAPTWVVAGTQT